MHQQFSYIIAIKKQQTVHFHPKNIFRFVIEKFENNNCTLGPIYGFGIYLAFQDSGACMQLMHVKVSYKYCPPVTSEFGIFPVTHTGSSATSIINQEGKCVENARSTGSRSTPSYHCGSDGEWILNSNTCQCKTGYQSNFERTECTGMQKKVDKTHIQFNVIFNFSFEQ